MTRRIPATDPIGEKPSQGNDRVIISTDSVAPSDRFEWWRNEFRLLHKVEVEANSRRSFTALGEHWQLGSIVIGRYTTPARRVVRTSADVRRSGVDHVVLRIAPQGVLVSRGSSGTFRVLPGQVAVSSFSQDYDDHYSAGEWIAAMIPRHMLPGVAAAPGVLSGAMADLLGDYLLSLVKRLPEASPSELPAIAETTRLMIGTSLGREAGLTSAERSIVIRERVERLIRENLASARLTPERICALAGISRSTLYRLFEARGGVSAYVQAMRLKSVHAELSKPQSASSTIASLAASQGLHNAAAFNRAFRQQFGCTPGDVRAAVLRAGTIPLVGASTFPAQSFADLLR